MVISLLGWQEIAILIIYGNIVYRNIEKSIEINVYVVVEEVSSGFYLVELLTLGLTLMKKIYCYGFRHLEIAFTITSANPVESPEGG